MLKKWLYKVLLGKRGKTAVYREIIPFTIHRISEDMLNFVAEKVVRRLHNEGFEAYMVGEVMRDLLLDIEPRDFDIAISTTPEEVREIFRRNRIIGRRLQIVRVMVGPETIEVMAFRSGGKVV